MKSSVYLDTTIFSYLVDNRNSISNFIDVTRQWWSTQRQFYQLYVSELVIAELKEGNYPNKKAALDTIQEIEVLELSEEIFNIAEVYLINHLMPKEIAGDASHLAFASFYKVDFLLTWNCKHLANANKKLHIRAINAKLGLHTPEIITPLELFKED